MADDDRTLTPQTPGELADVDQDRIVTLAEGTVDDVLAELEGLDVLELEQLAAVERQGKDRKTLLGAIVRELERRDAGADPEPVEVKVHNLGNATDYSAMRAKDVDPADLTSPVLTLDGWVLPLPKPQA